MACSRSMAMLALLTLGAAGCGGGTTNTTNTTSNAAPAATTDPAYLQMAKDYVNMVTAPGTPWTGPTTGAAAQGKKLIVYVSSDQRNGGPQGAGDGAQDAAKAIGWDFRILDGQGSVQGRTTALNQAIALKPAGIILGNVDTQEQAPVIRRAAMLGIALTLVSAMTCPVSVTRPLCTSTSTFS